MIGGVGAAVASGCSSESASATAIVGAVVDTSHGRGASSGQNRAPHGCDNGFSDGVANELLTMTSSDTTTGDTATLQVGIAP